MVRTLKFALFAVVVASLACSRQQQVKVIDAPIFNAPAPQTLTGVLDLVIGDPTGAGGEQVSAALVDDAGKRTVLLLARRQLDALGPEVRKPGTKVRITGEPVTVNGVPGVRVAAIALVTP